MDEKPEEVTILKIVRWMSGDENKRISDWMRKDDVAYEEVCEFMNECATCGWIDPKVSPFPFANEKAQSLAQSIYQKAMSHFGGAAR